MHGEPDPEPSVRPQAFRVAYVEGVTISKWSRIWSERHAEVPLELVSTDAATQVSVLSGGLADMSLVRLPIADDGLGVIPIYLEKPFVVVRTDHPIALFEAVSMADFDDEVRHDGAYDDAIALAAAGVGVAVVPQSIARLYDRRDVVSRPVVDGPETRIALAWLTDAASDRTEEFIGIVRGRTARSSRGATPAPATPPAQRRSRGDGSPRSTRGDGPPRSTRGRSGGRRPGRTSR